MTQMATKLMAIVMYPVLSAHSFFFSQCFMTNVKRIRNIKHLNYSYTIYQILVFANHPLKDHITPVNILYFILQSHTFFINNLRILVQKKTTNGVLIVGPQHHFRVLSVGDHIVSLFANGWRELDESKANCKKYPHKIYMKRES
jgi:hypothetical protein